MFECPQESEQIVMVWLTAEIRLPADTIAVKGR